MEEITIIFWVCDDGIIIKATLFYFHRLSSKDFLIEEELFLFCDIQELIFDPFYPRMQSDFTIWAAITSSWFAGIMLELHHDLISLNNRLLVRMGCLCW